MIADRAQKVQKKEIFRITLIVQNVLHNRKKHAKVCKKQEKTMLNSEQEKHKFPLIFPKMGSIIIDGVKETYILLVRMGDTGEMTGLWKPAMEV